MGGNQVKRKECIAMILAGGQGSRLGNITKNLAKPGVPFAGKYRIIDFTLSNCSNSDIDTVGVLTQYQPLILNTYIGIGSPWNLDRANGGVTLLPPYVDIKGGEWYKGTANAICQNINFIQEYNPEYVLILSGDHIYKMDYSLMIDKHKSNNAEVTIAVKEVPWDETNRFGIMNLNEEGRIIEFEEKPEKAKSNLASMGVYIFNWDILKKFLIEDENHENSSHDFGKDIIPKMLKEDIKIFSYEFRDYWKDVGTIESYFYANMDLLSNDSEFNLYDSSWTIYTEVSIQPPNYIGPNAKVNNSLINEGCTIFGKVTNSILFSGVYVAENVVIKDSLIFPNVIIEKGSIISKAIICENTIITAGTEVNSKSKSTDCDKCEISETGIVVVEKNTII